MNKMIGILLGAGLIGIAALVAANWEFKSQPPPPASATSPQSAAKKTASTSQLANTSPTRSEPEPANESELNPKSPRIESTTQVPQPPTARITPFSPAVRQPLETLLSSKSSGAQKQAAWKELIDSGKLDQALAELDRRSVEDPSDSECLAILGLGYLQKAGSLKDFREQGFLGLKADMTLEKALNVDPKNWEARYVRAYAMSMWPPELNKSQEVMESLVTLVEQQESQPPQPHFAQTYVLLGDVYKKAGYADLARETWQRGAQLYPSEPALPQRLAAQ